MKFVFLGLWFQVLKFFSTVFLIMHEVTTPTQAFVTPLGFYYAYTLQNKIYEFAASSNKILLFKNLKLKICRLPSTLALFTQYFLYHKVISLLFTIAHLLSLYLECS